MPKTDVKGLIAENHTIQGVETVNGEKFLGKYVIIAPGRSGAEWLQTEAQIRGLKTINNPVDIGVRVEVLASVMENLPKCFMSQNWFISHVFLMIKSELSVCHHTAKSPQNPMMAS